jgi:LacI family transcriptional regulator
MPKSTMRVKPARARAAVTIKQVAAAAEVAVGTVSRVINGHEDVDADLRSHVENVIRELCAQPVSDSFLCFGQ